MSLHIAPNMARLSVIGTGWSNTSIDSGGGFTVGGELWKDIADDLGYDYGDDVDWDLIADSEMPDFDWSDVIYKDADGNIYTDEDSDGIWRNPETGVEYPGGGTAWLPEDKLLEISDKLAGIADSDANLSKWSIPQDVLSSLYGGKVSTEINQTATGSDRPHTYTPACWYIQTSRGSATLFLDEPFYHGTASGESITVYDEAFSTRDGSSKSVYYSDCSTQFTDNYLPSPYSSYPIAYVCWQCLYGSLDNTLVKKKDTTKTTEDIKNGTSGLPKTIYAGGTYYMCVK